MKILKGKLMKNKKMNNKKEGAVEKKDTLAKWERATIDLSLGSRTPENKWEEELLQEINEMKKKGAIIEVPFDF